MFFITSLFKCLKAHLGFYLGRKLTVISVVSEQIQCLFKRQRNWPLQRLSVSVSDECGFACSLLLTCKRTFTTSIRHKKIEYKDTYSSDSSVFCLFICLFSFLSSKKFNTVSATIHTSVSALSNRPTFVVLATFFIVLLSTIKGTKHHVPTPPVPLIS